MEFSRVFSDHEGAVVTEMVAANSWKDRASAFLLNEEEIVVDPNQVGQCQQVKEVNRVGAERE